MNSTRICQFATAALTLATFAVPCTSQAELRSKSGDIVVMEPQNLPEAAQVAGNSLFVHATNDGSFYLYVEQQEWSTSSRLRCDEPGTYQDCFGDSPFRRRPFRLRSLA